jgi:hypothetical protein
MSINIQRETGNKTLNVSNLRGDSSKDVMEASISKGEGNSFHDEMGLEYFANKSKEEKPQEFEADSESVAEGTSSRGSLGGYEGDYGGENEVIEPYVSFEEEQSLRSRYLAQLKRLHSRGYVSSRRFGPEDRSSVIKGEIDRLKKEKEIESGVNYCKQGLVFFANTIEMVNRNLPNSPASLDGWSAQILKTQDDYDEVFEEIYCKYAGTIEMGPEIKLITMIASSAFFFHLNKMLVDKAAGGAGGVSDIIDLMNKEKKSRGGMMSGPSLESEELLRKLSNDDYDVSSCSSSEAEVVAPKKRKPRGPNKPKAK